LNKILINIKLHFLVILSAAPVWLTQPDRKDQSFFMEARFLLSGGQMGAKAQIDKKLGALFECLFLLLAQHVQLVKVYHYANKLISN
jgi:hypothetical protein